MGTDNVSVIICAYTEERWDLLCRAIQSVREQSLPSREIILVVDHNPALFERATAAQSDVRVAYNQQTKGLSGARNTGAALADSEIIAFLDDDAVAHENWLKFLIDTYQDPKITGVGGLTLPRWQTARPAWFPSEYYWVVGCNYTGMASPGTPVRNLIGANMSFRRQEFNRVAGGFESALGRTSSGLPLSAEEVDFCIRLAQQVPGSRLVMDYRAMVWHFVPGSRCTFAYFLSRCFAEGISKARVTARLGSEDGLSAEWTYTTRTLPRGVLSGIADLFRRDVTGVGRSVAIVVGLGATVSGYIHGRLGRVWQYNQPRINQPEDISTRHAENVN